mmetsp:Transcript_21623/g.37938  ORF Transcript_21623/g.37938 Transcript_21623/m.37938 type:complete len:220 (+) Transcript_21623:265-924(+)
MASRTLRFRWPLYLGKACIAILTFLLTLPHSPVHRVMGSPPPQLSFLARQAAAHRLWNLRKMIAALLAIKKVKNSLTHSLQIRGCRFIAGLRREHVEQIPETAGEATLASPGSATGVPASGVCRPVDSAQIPLLLQFVCVDPEPLRGVSKIGLFNLNETSQVVCQKQVVSQKILQIDKRFSARSVFLCVREPERQDINKIHYTLKCTCMILKRMLRTCG